MNKIDLLKSNVMIADIHRARIEGARQVLKLLFPLKVADFEKLDQSYYPHIDQLILRFSHLQDLVGAKILPQYLDIMGEDVDKMTFIDCLYKLEKLNFIQSADTWKDYRILRNHLTHEYPNNPDLTARYLNAVYTGSGALIDEWAGIREKISAALTQMEK